MVTQDFKTMTAYQIPVLMYHQIVKKKLARFNYFVPEDVFFKQMKYLKENNFRTFTFYDVLLEKHLDHKGKGIVITFDDGYQNNYDLAYPILKHFGFKASIYLVTGTHFNAWDVIANHVPKTSLMSPAQIIELADYGIEFGGHTHMHQNLLNLSQQALFENLKVNKLIIEELVQREIISMAYPYGAVNNVIKTQVETLGYKYALAVKSGPLTFLEDPLEIRRIDINKRTISPIFKTKTSGNYHRQKFMLKHWLA